MIKLKTNEKIASMNEIYLGKRIWAAFEQIPKLNFIKQKGTIALEVAHLLLNSNPPNLEIITETSKDLELIEILLGLERSLLFWNSIDYTQSNKNKKLGNWFSRNEQRKLRSIDKIESLLRFYLNKQFLSNTQRSQAKKLIARANLLGA